jgi:hypothetical protein
MDQTHVKPAEEICEDNYIEMLEVLPPGDWVRRYGQASFYLTELYTDDITDIFVWIGNRFFRLRDRYTLTHDERIAKVRETFPDA